jgi:hypothetical protein
VEVKSLTLGEEQKFRVFVPKREEVTGGWRKLHSEEFISPETIKGDQQLRRM